MRRVTLNNTFPVAVLVDTREQHFYTFRSIPLDRGDGGTGDAQGTLQVITKTLGLASGDYSLMGYADKVAVERKSLADLYSTVGQGRERFERELERLTELDFAAVVVEAEWSEVIGNPPRHSGLSPKTIYRSVLAWQQRYPRCHWWFCGGREFAELTTFRILQRYWTEREKERKGGCK